MKWLVSVRLSSIVILLVCHFVEASLTSNRSRLQWSSVSQTTNSSFFYSKRSNYVSTKHPQAPITNGHEHASSSKESIQGENDASPQQRPRQKRFGMFDSLMDSFSGSKETSDPVEKFKNYLPSDWMPTLRKTIEKVPPELREKVVEYGKNWLMKKFSKDRNLDMDQDEMSFESWHKALLQITPMLV